MSNITGGAPETPTSDDNKLEVTLGRAVIGALAATPGFLLATEVLNLPTYVAAGLLGGGAVAHVVNRNRMDRQQVQTQTQEQIPEAEPNNHQLNS